MTLVEFIAPVRGKSYQAVVLATMYFLHRYENKDAMRAEEIRAALVAGRVPKARKMNVADVLNRSGASVDSPGSDGTRRLWVLTETGSREVRELLDLPEADPEIEHDVALLQKLAANISDIDARGFIEEAIRCLQVGALRAAVVFLWSGAIRTLHQHAWSKGVTAVNSALTKHDPGTRGVKKLDDFASVRDALFIKALQDMGIVDKGQKGTLEDALNLRNRCGHPTKYRPGEKKASSFIEDVVGIVF